MHPDMFILICPHLRAEQRIPCPYWWCHAAGDSNHVAYDGDYFARVAVRGRDGKLGNWRWAWVGGVR